MPDFTELLKQPAGQAKKPPALDVGNYPGIIKSFEVDNKNKNQTPYVRFHVGLTGWPADSEPQTLDGGEPIDLTKRQMRRDYYLTPDALWRLDEFLRNMGVDLSGRGYDEVLPELVNQPVLVSVKQYLGKDNEPGNEIDKLGPLE